MKKLIFVILLSPATLFATPNPDVNQAKPTYGTELAETDESELAPGPNTYSSKSDIKKIY